jgi:hypothetical protein
MKVSYFSNPKIITYENDALPVDGVRLPSRSHNREFQGPTT